MIGSDFIFDGHKLSDYGLIMCLPDSSQQFIGKELNRQNMSPVRAVSNVLSVSYNGGLELSMRVIKDVCNISRTEDAILTGDEIHYVRSWLESPNVDTELVVEQDDEDVVCTHYYGVFSEIQPYEMDGDCFGLDLVFSCNAPYGFTDVYKYVYTKGEGNTLVVSNLSSEKHNYFKPIIRIYSASTFGNESLMITNENDGSNSMTVTMPTGLSQITIDCDKQMVYDDDGSIIPLSDIGVNSPAVNSYSFLSADAFLFYWLRLAPNINRLSITPSTESTVSKVEIIAQYPVKSGGY